MRRAAGKPIRSITLLDLVTADPPGELTNHSV
jgi:hypothetical protein